MRLLKKSEASVQSQEIKRQQIQEGTDLVKRVEALRIALASLQSQHKHFIESSKEELNRETLELYSQINTLKSEVESLQSIKEELQKPLDAEWRKVRDLEKKYTLEMEKVEGERDDIKVKGNELYAERKRVAVHLERTEKLESDLEKRNKEAEKNRIESEKTLKEIQNKRDNFNSEIEVRLREVLVKEKEIELKKKELNQISKVQEIKEEELNKKERQLNDRSETIERTIKRSKDGKR